MVRRVLTATLCGVAALLAPGRAVVTAVPRRRPVLKPGGKEEAKAPPRRLTFGGDCPETCYGYTCDWWIDADYTNTCPILEAAYLCDCDGCDCDGGTEVASPTTAPTHSASPTGSHAPTVTPTQVGAFGPFRFACNSLAEGGYLNVEVINDITFGQQIDLDGDRSLRVFCHAAASRKALSGGGATRLFDVADGVVLEIVHLELRDGYAHNDGGFGDGERRGGVFLVYEATLVLVDCLVRGGSSDHWGGGMFLYNAVVTIMQSEISDCEAGGGGLYVQSTTLTITNSILRGNVATYDGGAVSTYSGGTFVNTTIEDNAAGGDGGGVYGSGTFDNVKFIGNYAQYGNGGVLNAIAASTLTRCVLTDNDAADLGAAIYAIAAVVLSYSVVRGFAGGAGASSIFYFDNVADVSEFDHVRFSDNSLVAIRSAGGSRVVVRNSEGGLAAADVQNVDVLGCADATDSCPADYCSNADIGINCHCYPDGVKTDPNEGPCVSSPQITVPTAEFDILVDKADATGRASVLFSNAGGESLSFVALVLTNGENVAWVISPRAGNLTACEIGNITLAANVLALQSRAAPYLTRFVVNSNSFAAATRDIEIIVRMFVSASASATNSFVNVTNIARLTAAGTIEYTVTSIDATGVAIRDAANTAYVTTLRADDASVDDGACGVVAYDAAADRHAGSCALPGRAAGRFSLEVALGSELVGGGAQHVTVARCPPSFILTADGSECTCAAGRYALGDDCAACAAGTAKAVPGVDKSNCVACETVANYTLGLTSNADRTACDACEDDFYRADDDGGCHVCPTSATCEDNVDVASMRIERGYWRAGDESATILACRFDVASCPGDAELSSTNSSAAVVCRSADWPYCACGYAGPQCAECDTRGGEFYFAWTSGTCERCGDGASHAPTIVLLCVLGGLLLLVGLAFMKVRKSKTYQLMQRMYRVGRVKLSVILFNCQVISQFASVVTSTSTSTSSGSGTGGYPPSATTFAAGLGLSNIDIAAFVPVGCIFPATSFYDKLVFKTVSPVVVISLLWTPTLVKYITRKESANSARTAARWSLFLLELIVSSVSTSVVQTFACTEFDDGWYLAAELTLACDASPERKLYQAYSGFMIIVYPIGVPLMFLVLMFVYRDDVEQFVQKMKDHDATHDTFSYAQDFAELTKAATPTAASSTTTVQERRPSRRPSMMITQATDLMWLSSKLDKFQPQSWWTSSYLVAMRILQTSAMVFIASPSAQAAIASLIALIAVSVQTHTAPYRRASDNRAALVATWVIFIWCFVLLVRYSGAVSGEHGVVLGVILIVATVAMVGEVVRSLVVDVREDGTKRAQRDASRDDAGATSAAGAAQPEDGTEAGGAAAATAGRSASPDGGGGAATPAAPSGPSSWDLSALVCGASAEGEKTAEELVTLLREENAAQLTKNAAQQTENAAQRELISRQELEHAAQQTENAAQRERISRLELELAQLPR